MKILIYGAGVIGCTYGCQFSSAEHDVSLLVRKGKAEKIKDKGIHISCADYRSGKRQTTETMFCPKVIENLSSDNDFEYILITVSSADLMDVLPSLSKSAGKAHIIFFLNLWDEFDEISGYFLPHQYSYGFPFMAGGRRNGNIVDAIISGSKYSKTMLGNADGKKTPELEIFSGILDEVNLKPFISGQIINWLVPHYVFIAAISAGIINSGGTTKNFLGNKKLIKDTVKAIREGFGICTRKGINPKREKVNQLYYLPFFICIPVMRKIFSNEDMASMFDGYLKHSVKDIKFMLDKVILSAKPYDIEIPYLTGLRKSIDSL